TTWACVGVASEPSLREEEYKTGRQSAWKRANPHGRRVRGGSPENAGADAVGDVRLAPASRLGEPHPPYHLQHHNIPPSHLQQHTPSAIEHHFLQLVAAHHQQQQQRQQQHGGPFQNSTYTQQKQEMSPEEEGGRVGGSPPAAGAALHQPHHPRTASPPSGTEPCTRDAIPTPTPIADTTTTATTTMTMQSQSQQQKGPSPSPSPTGGDVEKFDGKIVYNPDGSAYIIEGESELSEDDSLPDGCIVDGRGVSVPHSLVFPQIASAYYVSRLYAHQAYQQQQQQQQQRSATQQHNPDLPVMHSYRVISYRSAEGSKQPPPAPTAPPPPAASVPVKPILMCFICKLSFGYAKSFVAHAQGEHQLTLMEDERQILSHSTASAIIQAVGRGKQPLVSFLEPVTSSTCTQASPTQIQAQQQQQQRSESNEHETTPTTTSTPASTPGVPSSPQQQQQSQQTQQQRPSPNTPTTPTSHSSHPLTYNHQQQQQQHPWTGAQVSAASWAKAPDAMHYSSPPPPTSSTKGSPSSYAALTQAPPNFLTGTTIGVCPEHMQGRPSGVECPKCELILTSSRLAGPGGALAGIHSRNSCKTLKCPKCNWHYKYQETLEIHMKEKHPESETSCFYCNAGQPHPRLARGETYTCGYKPYRCEVCNYSTTTKGNLSIHMQSDKHLNNMQELQQGGGGGSGTSNPSSSQDAPMPTRSPHHQQNHSPHRAVQSGNQSKPKLSFRCDICNYETNVARNLRIHMTSEKHTHNSMVLHQNIKHMQTLSALSHHQQAQHHHQQQQQQQLEHLLHLGGLDKPQPTEAALADLAYNQAVLMTMMTGGQMPQFPPELIGSIASAAAMSNLGGDVGLSPDSMEPPPEPADQDPNHLYQCCICNNFATDSLEALSHHLAVDRTRTREGDILAVANAHFVCKLCTYKTNLKANFQLHCKTDKHLQRLQHMNHVKEGGPRNEWKLKYLASPTSAAQLRCHACDYYTNSAHKLALHAALPRHEAASLLLRHLLEASSNIQTPGKWYHCVICGFSARHRLPLLQHVRSLRHLHMEQIHHIHRRSTLSGNESPHADISVMFQVTSDPDVPSTQQPSPTTPTTPNATSTNNERREEGSDCGSEVKQEPDNDPEPEAEAENDQEEITCLYCTYQPTSREELRQHLQVAHVQDIEEKTETVKEEPATELLCPLCQDSFKERPALEKHVMQIHSVNTDGLQRLLLLVDQSHWLNNNRNTSTPAVTTVTTPTSPTTTTKTHQEEEMSERGDSDEIELARCNKCDRVWRSIEEFRQHHCREAHPTATPTLAVSEKHVYKYRCVQCSLAFKTLEKLQQHSQYHAIRDATKCALCGRSFRSVQALQRHLESVHELHEDEMAQYKQSLLHAHPLLQAITEETLKRQAGLASELHVEDDAGRGDEEESDASDSSPLQKEQRLLEDYLNSQTIAEDSYQDPSRKFKCHRCKVAFTRQSYLTGHNKTLLHRKGEKMSYPMEKYLDPNRPYKCDVCKESFTQKNILLVHYNSVSHLHKLKRAMQEQGNNNTLISVVPPASPTESPDSQQDQDKKPYKCNICKVAYSQGSTLDIHMRSVLHQTRASKLQDLAASGQLDLGRPLIEQPPLSPNSPPANTNTGNTGGMASCSRCNSVFVNQDQLAAHQQLCNILNNPALALFQQFAVSQQLASSAPSKTPPPTSTTPGPQHMQSATQHSQTTQDILSQPRHKTSQMYKHLLESFGFDLVMQFNENHQRRQRKEEEAAAALQAQQEQQKQEQQKQALAAQAMQEKEEETEETHMDDDVIPELTRSTCQHCNKEFSSVWVLKAHCEEVHRDLVPREFLEKYAQQFKCEYEKKSVVVTVATSSSTTTAPRSSTPAAAQPQDLSADKESREKEKEENPENKELPMMLPPPPYDGATTAYPPINQADLLAKQHLAIQQQQAAAAAANAAASQKRARTRITDEQLKILRAHFDINNSPGEEQILEMASQSGLPPKVIKHWFRNTLFKERQRNKDSPYNFNNPPSTTLNIEEYEKTGEAKVTPLNSSVSGSSSSDDKSPNKQATPPPSMQNTSASQSTEIKQETLEQSHCQQQQQAAHQDEQHHSPGSSGGQQSRPHSPALSMSSVFSAIHHDISSHPPSTTNAPSTPMLPPKLASQNFANPSPGTGSVVPSAITAIALTPQRSLSPGRGPADYFGGNSNGSNTSGGSSGKRANRTRFTDYQIKVLQEFFENNAYPKDDDLEYLSKLLGLSPRVIVVWFQNARQKARKVYENQPATEPVTPGGRESDDGSGRFQRTPGLNYQCKKCLLQQALTANQSSGVASDSPHSLISMMQKRKFEDPEEGTGSDNRSNSEHSEQPKDKRLRTTILPEQLDYLYQKYQIESNPSRKMLETIAREVGLKKRVVQVWFQNTRARERKGQFRAHSQVINKRCPFCPALFKVKSALESHLSSKHADQVARGEVNIDNIPDEELSMESVPSNSSTPHMMPPLFPPINNSDMEASFKSLKYYEEIKRYFSDIQAHNSNGKQETANHQASGNSGESPLDLSKPVDLSRPMKLCLSNFSSLLEEQHGTHFRGSSDCGPLTDLSERSICDDDSMSETTEFLDDESGPASPASSTQSSRQGPASANTGNTSGTPVTGGQSGGNTSQSGGKRYRTQMSATQVKVMKSLFSDYKTPTMAECEMLGREIGLPKRVVQVWFQNARAKEKKARLAAGLPAEGSAVQPHRGPTGPDECRLCSVRYSAKTPLQEHVFSRRHIESVRVAVEEGSLVPPTPGAPIVPSGSGAAGVPGIGNSPVITTASQQVNQQQQQQSDENMMYGSVFLHPTAMFQSQQQQQQHPATAAASATNTTAGECLADLND
ncbi:Uncharacterized protein DBV15_05794, partial [Temnothorax longispinosus]